MNSDMNTPDLVRRAAARLSGAAGRAPVTELDTSMVRPVDAPIPLSPAVAKETADQLVREAPARPAPGGLHVNVSPTSLASNGISLPSNGFVRTVEEFRVIKRQVLSNVARAPMTPGSDLNRVIMI